MDKFPIIFAGAGPGDPDLITVKAMQALGRADLVIYAGSLVPEAVLKWVKEGADIQSSASMHLNEIIGKMILAHNNGKQVVRLHTGDPALYGAIAEQISLLDGQSVPYEVIPGVSAAFAAAAAMKTEYTIPEVSQTLILTRMAGRTPTPEAESLKSLAAHKASMAIYLSAGLAEEVSEILINAYGEKAPCAVAYRVSHPDQKIIRTTLDKLVSVMKAEEITRLALIIVGEFLSSQGANASKLYDKNFAHGYRHAE